MKALLTSAIASAVIALGWSAGSITPAQAYYPPQCISHGYYQYCLSNYYYPSYCIYETYYYHQYIYCRPHSHGYSSGGGGGSGY